MTLKTLTITTLIASASTAHAYGNHKFMVGQCGVLMNTRLATGGVPISVGTPLGISGGYAYRSMFATEFYATYAVLTSGTEVLLHGASLGVDYAVLGGQSRTMQVQGDSLFEVEFPYRLGLTLGIAQRSYDFSSIQQDGNIYTKNTVPTSGDLMGIDAGISLEIPISDSPLISSKCNYIAPSFASQSKQRGSLIGYGIGVGLLM